jgi:hypothetical protein
VNGRSVEGLFIHFLPPGRELGTISECEYLEWKGSGILRAMCVKMFLCAEFEGLADGYPGVDWKKTSRGSDDAKIEVQRNVCGF